MMSQMARLTRMKTITATRVPRVKKSGSQETSLYRTQTRQVAARILARSWRTREEEGEGVGEEVEGKDGENKELCTQQPNAVGGVCETSLLDFNATLFVSLYQRSFVISLSL